MARSLLASGTDEYPFPLAFIGWYELHQEATLMIE